MTVKRTVAHDDPVVRQHYSRVVERFPDCQLVEDDRGVIRFRGNAVSGWLFDTGQVDLNRMAAAYRRGEFPAEDYARWYMGLGYSVSAWLDVFADKLWPEEDNG